MSQWPAIDDLLQRVLRPTPTQRNLEEARERLVKLLAGEGYHIPPPTPGTWANGYYSREEWDAPCKNCDEEKPYNLYVSGQGTYLEINHGHYCLNESLEHHEAFLKAMIPVIGKLDAHAHYIPYDGGNGPWLRIYL